MKTLNFLLFLFLCSCGKEIDLIAMEEEARIATEITEDEKLIDSLFEAAIMENPDFFTDEEILQYFLLHDPTFVDPPVTSIGNK